jgi:D-glycero-alpha-D-manno-heptose-7-phosphate kinase
VLIVRSPVRISFGGGGTDLPAYYEQYGGAVLSTAINKYFYTVLGRRTDGRVQVISSDLRVFETWHDIANMSVGGSALEIPLAVLKALDCDLSVDLFLASEIPPGTGLGSSASVCVNILKTLTTYMHRSVSKYELAEQAFYLARNILTKHVGKQDEYAAAFGGLNFISFCPDGRTLVEPLDLSEPVLRQLQSSLMLFFTGSSHDSWNILQEQEKSTRMHASSTLEALHAVKALAFRMRHALQAGELYEFGKLLNEGWESKRRFSKKVSTPRIEQLMSVGLQSGALGGKITGAGGGGFLLFYCEPEHQSAVRAALKAEGVPEMAFAFDTQGAQSIVNDPFIDGDQRGGSVWIFTPREPAEPVHGLKIDTIEDIRTKTPDVAGNLALKK